MRARSMKSSIPGGPHDRTLHELRNPDKPRANHMIRSSMLILPFPQWHAASPRRARAPMPEEVAMPLLIVAALVWIAIHLGLAGTMLRDAVVGRIGEGPFRGVFSLLSIVALVFLVRAWSAAATTLLWVAPDWLRWLLVLAMLPAFVLFVASVSGRNPTMVGPSDGGAQPPRGVIRVTRHPMLWSFAIWAGVHIVGDGDTAAIV